MQPKPRAKSTRLPDQREINHPAYNAKLTGPTSRVDPVHAPVLVIVMMMVMVIFAVMVMMVLLIPPPIAVMMVMIVLVVMMMMMMVVVNELHIRILSVDAPIRSGSGSIGNA